MLALNKGKPELLNLKDIISSFVEFREEIVTKRTVFDLNKARNKAHILIGFARCSCISLGFHVLCSAFT